MNKLLLLAGASLVLSLPARATLADWYASTTATANNVVAATGGAGGGQTGANGGGWALSGTGVVFDYGNLSSSYNTVGDSTTGASFATIQYIFNLSDSGSSIALGTVKGYNNTENYVLKLEQYSNTGAFGATVPGIGDYKFTSDGTDTGANVASVFNQTVMVTFVLSGNRWNLYVNGTFAGQDTRGPDWRIWGGPGNLGSAVLTTGDAATGLISGVATYNRALTGSEVAASYAAFTAVPEPGSYGVMGAGMLVAAALVRRRRRSV